MPLTTYEIDNIRRLIQTYPVGTELAIAKVTGNELDYYGLRHSNSGIKSIDNRTSIFEIGSISKVLTCSVLAQMVESGIIGLEDSINKYLQATINNDTKITFKELATHTSGLPRLPPGIFWKALFENKDNPYKDYLETDLLNYLEKKLKLNKKGNIHYSNLGSGLLGYSLTQIAGCSYADLIQKQLFEPLKMESSTVDYQNASNKLVQGMDTKGRPTVNWDLGILQGAGGVLSCVEDMAKFIQANFDESNTAFSLQQKTMHKCGHQRISLGWYIFNEGITGEELHFHNGGTGGYRSSMIMNLNSKTGFIVLSNISGLYKLKSNKLDKLMFELIKNALR